MPPRGKSAPDPETSVSVQQTSSGDYALGAEVEGVFYPFVTASAAHVEAFVAKAKSASESSSSEETEEG